jgi:NitT/TauT family transport system ATP-binding protein
MDEPFAALDAQTREGLQGELLRIQRTTGTTVVFITHSIEEAVFLGQRVAVMTASPGRIKAVVAIERTDSQAGATESDVRGTAGFAEQRHTLWTLLHDEVLAAQRNAREAARG